MDIYKKSFSSVKCLGLDDILLEVCEWLISLNIGFDSYTTREVIESYSSSASYETYRNELKYYNLNNVNWGTKIAFTDKITKIYTDTTFTTLSSLYRNYQGFGIHRIYSEDESSHRNTNQRINIYANSIGSSGSDYNLATDTFFWKVNMSVYVKDKNNIVITYEDGTSNLSGTLLGCSYSYGSGLVACSCGDEQYFLYKPNFLENSIGYNTVIGSDISLWYGFPQLDKSNNYRVNKDAYMLKCRLTSSTSTTCSDEKLLDYVYETNASNLVDGEFYTINNKEYLCFSETYGLLMEC